MVINILHIWGPTYRYNFGGQYIFWKYAYENWKDNNVCHKVIDYDDNSIKDARSLIQENDVVHREYTNRFKRFLWAINLLWSIIKYRKKYDLLHVHTSLWGGLLAAILAKWLGKPILFESVLEGSDNPSSIPQNALGNVMLWCLRHFTKIIAISGSLANDYMKFQIPVETIPNSVDTLLFSPVKGESEKMDLRKDFNIPQNASVLLFVGSVKYRKGVDILTKMFVKMAEQRLDLFLLVVGPKSIAENRTLDMQYVEDLYSLLQSKHLMDRMKFTGMVGDKKELSNYYKTADIFVFPTRQEGLGNVVLEAAASQLPVVVTHLPEIEDIIQDKFNGLFIPKDDIDAFEEAVSLLLDNASLAEELAVNAREYVVKNFNYNNWQSNLIKCYMALV